LLDFFTGSQIAFADLDGDADLDVAVLNYGTATVGIPATVVTGRNLGHGVLADPVYYPVSGSYPSSMVLGDIDGDGDQDIVTCGPENYSQISAPGRVSLLLNNGSGAFASTVSYPTGGVYSTWAVLADVDNDGDLDAVTSNYVSSDISTLMNDGQGGLSAPIVQSYPFIWPGFLAAGDINGDGVVDLVVNKFAGLEAVTTMFGNGDGTFTPGAAYYPSATPAQLLLMDLDEDGDMDLVVSSGNVPWQPVTFTTLTNQAEGTFANPVPYWAPGMDGATALATADINGDGIADVAVATNSTTGIFFGNTGGTFAPGVSYGSGEAVAGLALGDLDGDGDIDLGTANSGGNSSNYSILWNRHCHVATPTSLGDLNGDGEVDLDDYALLAACLAGPDISAPPPGCSPVTFGRADLTHDGHVEMRDASQFLDAFGAP
jgi:hypothetical protein